MGPLFKSEMSSLSEVFFQPSLGKIIRGTSLALCAPPSCFVRGNRYQTALVQFVAGYGVLFFCLCSTYMVMVLLALDFLFFIPRTLSRPRSSVKKLVYMKFLVKVIQETPTGSYYISCYFSRNCLTVFK